MNSINTLQLYAPKSWAGLTTENHLHTIFAKEPNLASTVMTRVFGLTQYKGLDYILSVTGEQELPDDSDYRWYLKGDDEQAVDIVGYDATDVNRPGLNKTIFKITLKEKFFVKSDLLVLDDNRFRVRVVSDPYSDGVNWVYEVQLMTADDTLFVPPSILQAGCQVSKDYSPQSRTLNRTYGEVQYTSPFLMQNAFSFFTKKYVVPGNMEARPLVIEMLDPKTNKPTKIWTQYAEWVFLMQWQKEKERNLWFSEANRNTDGTYTQKDDAGFPIIEGAGLRQQISPSYKFNYTNFTLNFLEDVLLELSINILPEDQRHFVAFTGERGMVQFHRAIQSEVLRFVPMGDERRLAVGSGQKLEFGGQYVRYRGPQGVIFDLVHLPLYDDVIRNRILHPDGGPVESYRYTILHMGTTKGKKNIRRVYPKGRKEGMWHVAGSTSPYKGLKTSFREAGSSGVDGYELYAQACQGILIENPMACAELIYESA